LDQDDGPAGRGCVAGASVTIFRQLLNRVLLVAMPSILSRRVRTPEICFGLFLVIATTPDGPASMGSRVFFLLINQAGFMPFIDWQDVSITPRGGGQTDGSGAAKHEIGHLLTLDAAFTLGIPSLPRVS
jgi:hypothetical protein